MFWKMIRQRPAECVVGGVEGGFDEAGVYRGSSGVDHIIRAICRGQFLVWPHRHDESFVDRDRPIRISSVLIIHSDDIGATDQQVNVPWHRNWCDAHRSTSSDQAAATGQAH